MLEQFGMQLLNSQFGGGLGSSLGGGLSKPTPTAGPSRAEAAVYGSGLDSSGWNVNFSGTQKNASTFDKSTADGFAGIGQSVPVWVWIAAAAAVAWKLRLKK